MTLTPDILDTYRQEFDTVADECSRFAVLCRSTRLQTEHSKQLRLMIERTTRLKGDAVATRDEAIANELDMYIALKQDAPGRAWTHLVNAQMAASHAVKAHEVAARLELLYIPRLHALERLCFPKQVFASVSFIV